MKKALYVVAIIACIIVASIIGWYVMKFAVGILFFLVFACGGVAGFGIGRLFPRKRRDDSQA